MPETIRDKYQYFTQADIGKLRAAGYSQPITRFEDAVRDCVVNYLVPGQIARQRNRSFRRVITAVSRSAEFLQRSASFTRFRAS